MAAVRGQRPRRVVDHDVGTVPENLGLHTDRGDQPGVARRDPDGFHPRDGFPEGPRQVGVRGRELVRELVIAPFERGIALGDEDALIGVSDPFHVDAQPEPVEQLRPKLALLRVHGADQDEA